MADQEEQSDCVVRVYLILISIVLFLGGKIARADQLVYDLNIPSQNAAKALDQLAEQTGAITLFPFDLAEAEQANAVIGRYTLPDALALLFIE